MKNSHNVILPFPNLRNEQELIINSISRQPLYSTIIINAPTGIGKSIATLSALVSKMDRKDRAIIFVKTIAQIEPFLREFCNIKVYNKHSVIYRDLTILPLLGKNRICNNTCTSSRSRFNKISKKQIIEWLNIINTELISHPSVESFLEILNSFTNNCSYDLTKALTSYADIIITTYPFVNTPQFQVLTSRMKVNTNQILCLVDEAHNLLERRYVSINLQDIEECISILGRLPILETISKIIKMKPQSISYDQFSRKPIKSIIEWIKKISSFEMERMGCQSNTLEFDCIKSLLQFLKHINRGEIFVHGNNIFITQIDPSKKIQNLLDSKLLVFQSATFIDLVSVRKLFRLPKSTKLLNLNRLPYTRDNNYSPNYNKHNNKQFRAWLSILSTRKRERTSSMFMKIAEIVLLIHRKSPRHTLVLCPSYEFIDSLVKYIPKRDYKKSIVVETRSSLSSDLYQRIMSHTQPILIFGNARGKIREGNEWVKNGHSLVSTVILAGLATHVPAKHRIIDIMTKNYLTRILKQPDKVKLFQYDIPLITNVIQSYGRSIRHREDRGALIILDRRAIKPLHQELSMRRYQNVEDLMSDLGLFFEDYGAIQKIMRF